MNNPDTAVGFNGTANEVAQVAQDNAVADAGVANKKARRRVNPMPVILRHLRDMILSAEYVRDGLKELQMLDVSEQANDAVKYGNELFVEIGKAWGEKAALVAQQEVAKAYSDLNDPTIGTNLNTEA